MFIGIPRENKKLETRVAATPDSVRKMCDRGFNVIIEESAGLESHFTDDAYKDAGADIVDKSDALSADVVCKIHKPEHDEIDNMKKGSVLLSFLDICNDDGTFNRLADAGINSLALEMIPRISRAQSMDALSSQANIGGYRATLEAAHLYGRFLPMMMTSAGSAKPAKVMVLGAGVAGLQAIATAKRLGSQVYAYDVRAEVKEQIESLGAKFVELKMPEDGTGEGGYAKKLNLSNQQLQQELLAQELKSFDIVISTAMIPCMPAPVLITEDAVKGMKQGSVIVDMAAASGGNCPLTVADETNVHHGVTICGTTNFPALMPSDASNFYSRNLINLLFLMLHEKQGKPEFKDYTQDEITQLSLVTCEGNVCYERRI
ncbi:NAD(P) transhydrogenase alpha subunit [hydrothermal vent metagenome]|uniref:proton-translocating NAD(P)(+) transhydrogenase n=1 Tax=hydrothermal vent metagenome TaxID=652676 RepID=A0A3B0ZS81_9ZZZZ